MTSLLFTAALALATPEVSLPVIGAVPLDDAAATCDNDTAIGAVAEAAAKPRASAFGAWATPRVGANGAGWPRTALDVSYVGTEMNWVPRGVITSCWAVARHHVALGLELRALCDDDRSACRARFADDEQDALKEASKGKVKDRHDEMFSSLSLLPNLHTWRDPRPFLEKACTYPQQAASAGHFIDVDDLAAARSACVQLIELLEGDSSPALQGLPCGGSWAQRPSDVLPSPETDLGTRGPHADVQLATVIDKLVRMHDGPGTCDASADWGATWRDGLVERWREAQTQRACVDGELPLPQRLELCPTLVQGTEADCRRQDESACDLLAQLHLEGVGVPVDEHAAFAVWQASCDAAHAPACEALHARGDRIQSWLDEALAKAQALPPGETMRGTPEDPIGSAMGLLTGFATAMGPEWVATYAPPLFDASVAAQRVRDAEEVISLYGGALDETWKADARERLGDLKTALEKATAR